MITAERTLEIVEQLAEFFEVPAPKVFMENTRKAYYRSFDYSITMRPTANEWVVLHEFAHHLHYLRIPKDKKNHGEGFYWCLRHTVDAFGMKDYPWRKEYLGIKHRAIKDGLILPSEWDCLMNPKLRELLPELSPAFEKGLDKQND